MSPAAGVRLALLDAPAWDGEPLVGARPLALLAALVLEPRGLGVSQLVEQVWADDRPANPGKALQVLVSRVRAATDASVVEHVGGGYRLGLAPAAVDALALGLQVSAARDALREGDAARAADLAEEALAGPAPTEDDAPGPLRRLRTLAARTRDSAADVLGRALSRRGRHAEALPLLEAAAGRWVDDAGVLADLLRTVAAVGGPAVALGRYEDYRADLASRLGVDPAPELQRLHRELLGADRPVRTGLDWGVAGLVGRDDDLARIRAALLSGRLTTVVGPGGIGKTSAAQLLAAESTLPRVHVVELVGVRAGDDVVAAVGGALGVRGSVAGRLTLTPAQQADVRGRLVQELDQGPCLLVLDNCEHVLEPVASLVAFLLASTRDLVVLATSRAPLRLAAERVVTLSHLAPDDAAALFERRARAVRPDAVVDADAVRAVVDRLDGLPLAVELAAARVSTMSVAEVARALGDRFSTLRTRDRGVPDRHRTLESVIDWSWDLLAEEERRALAWLSVFQDGVDRASATAVLGPGGDDLLDALVEQSLLVVADDGGTARFRALETIREFALARLERRGERAAAVRAQQAWALELVGRCGDLVVAPDQVERVAELVREQNTLTDVLRQALAEADRPLVARLVAALGSLWTVTGDQPRIFSVCDAAAEVLAGWEVPDDLHVVAQEAAGVLVVHLSWMPGIDLGGLVALLEQGPPPSRTWGLVAHTVWVPAYPAQTPERLAEESRRQPPAMAVVLLLWAAIVAENAGDVQASQRYARAGLEVRPPGGLTPYLHASLHAQLCQLALATGDHRAAARHAETAWPALLRVHAGTDAYALQVATALAPLHEGDVDAAEQVLDRFGPPTGDADQVSARMTWLTARAEVARARGDVATALEVFDEVVALTADLRHAGQVSPWLAIAVSSALVARVHHVPEGRDPRGEELLDVLLHEAVVPGESLWFTDLPLNGIVLVALGAWALRHGSVADRDDGTRLLAVAHRWAYNRSIPVLAWGPLRDLADTAGPGRLDGLVAELAGRPAAELVPEVSTLVDRLRRDRLTSSG